MARDAAHKRLIEALDRGEKLPFDLSGQTLYYMGPSPARPGHIIGSAGPTTSSRMDMYTPRLLAAGIRAMIGKGGRSPEVREAIQKYKAAYFVTLGGAGALLARTVKQIEVVAYDDLGPEAMDQIEKLLLLRGKEAIETARGNQHLKILGGFMNNKLMTKEEVEFLAQLPGRDELLAKLVGSIKAPVANFVYALNYNIKGLLYLLTTIKKQ